MHFPQALDLRRLSRTSSTSSTPSETPPAAAQGAQVQHSKRARKREAAADPDDWLPVLNERDNYAVQPDAQQPGPFGHSLSRVRTRLDSSCLWDDPSKSTQAALRSSAKSDESSLYKDAFVELTSNRILVRHLLCRKTVAFDLHDIRRARPFCSAARLVQLEAQHRLDGKKGRLAGLSNGGLGGTGIIWARDKSRIHGETWKEQAVVMDTGGVLGKVGFTVERPKEWWRAFETVRTDSSMSR
ncbi:hypothetical protein JCM10908_001253 [Rhodotorula pacifica]|uniref:uncharacterized protein n=1 Tax=Rhodotorula pacifica TaxID=1495444 RepID=UPI00317A0939